MGDSLGACLSNGWGLHWGASRGRQISFCLGIAGGDTEKEGDDGLGGSKDEEPDAASRRLPPQPEGLMAKGSHAASAGLNGEPAPPCARLLAWKPFAFNAAPIDYLDTLLFRRSAGGGA